MYFYPAREQRSQNVTFLPASFVIRRDAYRVHIQHIDAQIVGRQVHGLKNFAERHSLAILGRSDHLVRMILQRFFDESEQMLLIHARSCVYVGVDLQNQL